MPVFVEWKWQENTKSFLVIFHFYDDFSKPNLRIRKYEKEKERMILIENPRRFIATKEAWMTWAPSHSELGLLMELLGYANMINGLKEFQKRELCIDLEGRRGVYERSPVARRNKDVLKGVLSLSDVLREMRRDRKAVIYHEHKEFKYGSLNACFEISPEYIDYLRNLLKQYLK